MTWMKYALSLTLVLLLLFSESLPSSAHERFLNPRSGVVGQKMQEGKTQPAIDDLGLFHMNRKLGSHMNLIRRVPKIPRVPRPKSSAAIPSQIPSLRLGYFLCLCLWFFLL